MKTIKQWLKERLSEEDYKKAQEYKNETWEEEIESFDYALIDAFHWRQTREGVVYWNDIHNNGGSINTHPNTQKVDNNGWIKIESEADLPIKGIDCHFILKSGVQGVFINLDDAEYLTIKNRATHYQPIIKPLPPKF